MPIWKKPKLLMRRLMPLPLTPLTTSVLWLRAVLNGSLKLIMPEELDLVRNQAMLIDIRQRRLCLNPIWTGRSILPLTALRQQS